MIVKVRIVFTVSGSHSILNSIHIKKAPNYIPVPLGFGLSHFALCSLFMIVGKQR